VQQRLAKILLNSSATALFVSGIFVAQWIFPRGTLAEGVGAPRTQVHSQSGSNHSNRSKSISVPVKKNSKSGVVKDSPSLEGGFRGWSYLAQALLRDGVQLTVVKGIYSSRAIPQFTPIYFGLNPRESNAIYANFLRPQKVQLASQCLQRHYRYFAGAEKEFGVPREVLAALLQVETQCGQITGRSQIVYRLSRLASAADPNNVKANYLRHRRTNPTVTLAQVADRADYLKEIFYPEVVALIKIANQAKVSIHSLRGSSAGAFGFPQFLPSNYLKFGVDGDRNGKISLFSPADAIWSAAQFLKAHGWDPTLSLQENRGALWHYNRSEAYGDAVLGLAQRVQG
jgi:membrane-bound lytic murein transglycosylase B